MNVALMWYIDMNPAWVLTLLRQVLFIFDVLSDRALQEAQDIFGVDFDFDDIGYGEEDEFEEEDEVCYYCDIIENQSGKWRPIVG